VTPDLRVVNLEMSLTSSDEFAAAKAIHYRMDPATCPACKQPLRTSACWRTTM
jgi:hypothetical protein